MKKYLFFIFFLLVYNVNAQVDDSDEKISVSKNKIDIPGYIKLDFGVTFLENADASLDTDLFSSRSVNLYYSKPFFIGNNFSINPGIGISNDRLSFSNDVILSEETNADGINNIIVDTLDFTPEKNSLKSTYLILPLDIKYYFGAGKYDKGRFFIGIGGEIGLHLNSSTKVKQKINNRVNHTKIKKDFGVNDLKYGVSLSVGVGNFNLYYKKYLSNLFEDSSLPQHITRNPTVNKIGITFSLF